MSVINYPTKKKIDINKNVSYKNRGMSLEEDINLTNEYYLLNGIAVIHKKPTPIQVVDVYYPARNKAVIKEAYYKTPSTTDYNGIYKGKYIDFECKESQSKTSFPLANIHSHQLTHLESITKCGGIGFFIILFKQYNEIFLVDYQKIKPFYDKSYPKKSIPYSFFKENCPIIDYSYKIRINYLKVIDEIYLKEDNN